MTPQHPPLETSPPDHVPASQCQGGIPVPRRHEPFVAHETSPRVFGEGVDTGTGQEIEHMCCYGVDLCRGAGRRAERVSGGGVEIEKASSWRTIAAGTADRDAECVELTGDFGVGGGFVVRDGGRMIEGVVGGAGGHAD